MAGKTSNEILTDLKTAAVKRLTTLNPNSDSGIHLANSILQLLSNLENTTIQTSITTELEGQAKLNAIQASGADLVVAGSIGEIEVEIPDGATLEATVTSGDGTATIQ